MRILPNLTRGELEAYAKQPTAKKLKDRTMKDSVYIPAGDKDAAAVYMSSKQKWQGADMADKIATHDDVEISADGYALKAKEQTVAFSYEPKIPLDF